jgi:predicted membrane GTPase involved in stress response
VEVTPDAVRLRKVELDAGVRQKLARATKPDVVAAP